MSVPYAFMGVMACGERYRYTRAESSAWTGHSGVVWMELWIGIPMGCLIAGRTTPAATHAAFDLTGGYLGFLAFGCLRCAGPFSHLTGKR